MPKTAVSTSRGQRLNPKDRRAQIIRATIRCLSQSGPERWTLRQVSREIGIAPSLVTYFFASWGDLVVAAYDSFATSFVSEFSTIAADPQDDPEAKMAAYIERYFSDHWMSDAVAGAYIAFWALSRTDIALKAEMDRFSGNMRRDLFPLFQSFAEVRGFDGDIAAEFDSLYFLISGLWYELAVNPGAVPGPDPATRVKAYLDRHIPR